MWVYGPWAKGGVQGLLALKHNLAQEAGDILDARTQVKKCKSQAVESHEAFLSEARELAKARRRTADRLQTAMKKELKELAMERAVFEVRFEELSEDKASGLGLEKAEFFLASNPGEHSRPLAKVASGGELSRVMLAIKALQVYREPASTVIFDEVDAGKVKIGQEANIVVDAVQGRSFGGMVVAVCTILSEVSPDRPQKYCDTYVE